MLHRRTKTGWHVRWCLPAFEYLQTTGLGPRNAIAAAVSNLPAGFQLHDEDVLHCATDIDPFAARLPLLVESVAIDCYSGTKGTVAARQLHLVYFVALFSRGEPAPPAPTDEDHEHRHNFEQQICLAQICPGRNLAVTKNGLIEELRRNISHPRYLWRCLERRADGRPLRYCMRSSEKNEEYVVVPQLAVVFSTAAVVESVLSVTKEYEEQELGKSLDLEEEELLWMSCSSDDVGDDHAKQCAGGSPGSKHFGGDQLLSEEQSAALLQRQGGGGPVFVAGRSGAGKTTLLLHFALLEDDAQQSICSTRGTLVLTQSALLTKTLRAKYEQLWRGSRGLKKRGASDEGAGGEGRKKAVFSSYENFMRGLDSALGRLDGEFFLEENRAHGKTILSLGHRLGKQNGAISYLCEAEVDFKVSFIFRNSCRSRSMGQGANEVE